MYCQNCGTQIPDDASFCFKCGNDIGKFNLSETESAHTSKIPNKDESEVKFENRTKISDSPLNTSKKLTADTTKSSNEWSIKTYLKASLILAVIFVALMVLFPSNQSNVNSEGVINSPTQPKAIVLITANPAQMLPTINDMPDGTIKGSEKVNETHAERTFALVRSYSAQAINYEMNKFSSIDEAKQNYNSIKNEYSNYKLTSISLGDEGVGYSLADTIAKIVFRKANVVVTVELAGQGTTLQDAESYAMMVRVQG